jgi:hypothetical protein
MMNIKLASATMRHEDREIVLYQGTTSVVPQMRQQKFWALAPEECFSITYIPAAAKQVAEKLGRDRFCNKGTALAGPQVLQNQRGL